MMLVFGAIELDFIVITELKMFIASGETARVLSRGKSIRLSFHEN